jgi:hypothetical protein
VPADRVGVDAQLIAAELPELVGNLVLRPVAGAAVALERRPVHHAASTSGVTLESSHVPAG